MTTSAASFRRGRLGLSGLDLNRFVWPGIIVAVGGSGLLLFHLTRGTSFWADEWNFITGRRGNSVNTFLSPYQGHLSLVPIAIYRLLFAAFGIGSYTPYRALVIVLSLIVGILLFLYVRRRTGDLCGLLLAVPTLFLGPGAQNTMWAFQIAWLIVAASGIGALALLDRHNPRADIAACILVLIAVCSTSVGIAFAIGIAVDIALVRRRWRDAWIVVIPLGLYLIWALHYHPTTIAWSAITAVPVNVAEAAAAGLSTLAGLSGITPLNQNGTALVYGVPLLLLGLSLAAWLVARARLSARAISIFVMLATFTAMVTLVRTGIAPLLSSRYLYFYCLLVALLIAELWRGVRPSLTVQAALCGVCCLAVVSNIGSLRAFGAYMRYSGAQTDSALGALELDRRTTSADTLTRIALYPLMRLAAGAYFAAADALGTPAYSVEELRHTNAVAQSAADAQLVADGNVTITSVLTPGGAANSVGRVGTPLPVLASSNGTVTRSGACIRFSPAAELAPDSVASVTLIVRLGRLSVTAAAAPAALSIRRFAPTPTPLGAVPALQSTIVTIRPDLASDPWYVEVSSIAPVRLCSLVPERVDLHLDRRGR